MKKLFIFLFLVLILIGGAVYYFKVYDNHTGVRLYTAALDKGIKNVMDEQDMLTYKGLSVENKNVICLLEVPEITDDMSFVELGRANGVTDGQMRRQAKEVLYDQIVDLVKPVHELNYDFIIRFIGSETKVTFDIVFPHNE